MLAVVIARASSAAEGRNRVTREYDLKAAFLFNFAQFVEWPSEAFPDRDAPFTIGILGNDPFGRSIDEIVANETVRSRKIVVRRYRDIEGIGTCHILFIGPTEKADTDGLGAHLAGRRVLTVGEADSPGARHAIIQFVTVEQRLRLRINIEAAKDARLEISSKLLRQAEIVGSATNR